MLTIKDFEHVLVSYFSKPDKLVAKINMKKDVDGNPVPVPCLEVKKGEKKGVLVAIGPGIIGWSKCNTSEGYNAYGEYHYADDFDRARGLDIALGRAQRAALLDPTEREMFYSKVPHSMEEAFEEIKGRSYAYFQINDSE